MPPLSSSNVSRPPVLVLDIGGTKIAAAYVDGQAAIHRYRAVPTPAAQGGQAVLKAALAVVDELRREIDEAGLSAPEAVGIGSAGDIDPNTGGVVFATDSIPAWAGTPLRDRFESALSLPVAVDNDGNTMALGEARFGAGRGFRHVIGITVGTGIGGGLVLDGRVYHGALGVAGAIGHIVIQAADGPPCVCGGRGCLEMLASGPAIEAAYQRLAGNAGADRVPGGVRELLRLAESGDSAAWSAIAGGAAALGVGIASLLNLLNPECVVLAGGVAQIGDPYLERVRAAVHLHAKAPVRETPVLLSALGVQANLIGAAALAWDQFGL